MSTYVNVRKPDLSQSFNKNYYIGPEVDQLHDHVVINASGASGRCEFFQTPGIQSFNTAGNPALPFINQTQSHS